MLPNRMNQVVKALAAVGLTIGTAVITLATVTTLNVTTLTATTANSTTASTTSLVVGSGTPKDKELRATVTIDPASLGWMGASSSVYTPAALAGAVANDHCSINSVSGDALSTTSTLNIRCRATTDGATLFFHNFATSTMNAGSSVFSIVIESY